MSLILVDGSALVYRAHYAFAARPLTAPSGEVTSVAFGFCHSVLSLVELRRPERLAVVFDRNGFIYHGRVKEVADGARTAGLSF